MILVYLIKYCSETSESVKKLKFTIWQFYNDDKHEMCLFIESVLQLKLNAQQLR